MEISSITPRYVLCDDCEQTFPKAINVKSPAQSPITLIYRTRHGVHYVCLTCHNKRDELEAELEAERRRRLANSGSVSRTQAERDYIRHAQPEPEVRSGGRSPPGSVPRGARVLYGRGRSPV